MTALNEFLKTSDLYLTLTNERGEAFAAGKASYIKPLSTKAICKWKVSGKYGNISPFTYAVLHNESGDNIFALTFIKPVLPETETIIEMVYS